MLKGTFANLQKLPERDFVKKERNIKAFGKP